MQRVKSWSWTENKRYCNTRTEVNFLCKRIVDARNLRKIVRIKAKAKSENSWANVMHPPSFKILTFGILPCIVSQIVNRVNGIYSVGTNVVIVIGWTGQKVMQS